MYVRLVKTPCTKPPMDSRVLRAAVGLLVLPGKREPHQAKPPIGLAAIASVANIKVNMASLARLVRRGALARWGKK